MRRLLGSIKELGLGELAPNWEGPYRVTVVVGVGAYYLEDLEERPLLWPWNVSNLKKYFH